MSVSTTPHSSDAEIRAALVQSLTDFVEWAEEHRRNAKALGERPCIDAHRIAVGRKALNKAAGK